ncbi:hypothetical protein GLOIN_2v1877727 [Rhizophagus irregularis DAOM 181602=DAOM 197198]|nr:hypothetical protein GLOIN_2v1877727 [Rhizophagus irregularis DAOM 181602=DAOM 197198]
MSNVYTLKDIKDRGHRLGSVYEQELEKKIRSVTEFNSEINDLSGKLVDKYNEREKEFQRIYADMGNKASQLIASSTKVGFQLISERKSHSERQRELEAEVKSLKSSIKTLKREATLAQKALSVDKVQILSLETKIRELEGKLEDIDLERTYHDLDVTGGEPAQISSSEIESLRLEFERAKEDHNSKEYTIECMEKGIEATHEITSREIDALYSAQSNLMEENKSLRDQLELKENNEISPPPPPMNDSSQIISAGGAEMVSSTQSIPLLPAIPIVADSLMSPMLIYSILTLLLIAIIWFAGYLLSQYLIDYRISTGASGTSLNLLWMWANTFFDKSSGGFINIFLA